MTVKYFFIKWCSAWYSKEYDYESPNYNVCRQRALCRVSYFSPTCVSMCNMWCIIPIFFPPSAVLLLATRRACDGAHMSLLLDHHSAGEEDVSNMKQKCRCRKQNRISKVQQQYKQVRQENKGTTTTTTKCWGKHFRWKTIVTETRIFLEVIAIFNLICVQIAQNVLSNPFFPCSLIYI